MVVRVMTGKSIQGALSYNERKVGKGAADLLLAQGFPCEPESLGFTAKLNRFQRLNELRPKVKTNTVHLTLNFPPEEQLNDEQMKAIATDYMDRIGFARQPFIVYRHTDTRHPHLHIVTNSIQENGEPIPLHNLAKEKSEPARKAIEEEYGLIIAENRPTRSYLPTGALDLLPVTYGEEEVKHAITNILTSVVRGYKFTSFEEFNAILRQHNVMADRGSTNSRLYQTGGLVYALITPEGERIGRSIKASDIYGDPASPTLKILKKRFAANAVRKAAVRDKTHQAVRQTLSTAMTAAQFARKLQQRGIVLHLDQDRLGILKSVFFVDHLRKATFTHEELGVHLNEIYALRAAHVIPQADQRIPPEKRSSSSQESSVQQYANHATSQLLQILLHQQHGTPGPAGDPPRKKKKKRRPPL